MGTTTPYRSQDLRSAWVAPRRGQPCVTQMRYARQGIVTEEMAFVAAREHLAPALVRAEVARGRMIIPANINHVELEPMAIGIASTCKVNANIGNSALGSTLEMEVDKLRICLKYGADSVMDLSTGKRIREVREALLRASPVPIGTVPIYEAIERVKEPLDLSWRDFLDVIEEQATQGVDYMTLHAGVLWELVPLTKDRLTGIVSRGGSLMAQWMMYHGKQNPLFEHFDDVLDICARYDVAISLGDGLRPGCLADA